MNLSGPKSLPSTAEIIIIQFPTYRASGNWTKESLTWAGHRVTWLPLSHWVDPKGRASPHPSPEGIRESGYRRGGQGLPRRGRKLGESEVHEQARLLSTAPRDSVPSPSLPTGIAQVGPGPGDKTSTCPGQRRMAW